jgi:hypothetical protein
MPGLTVAEETALRITIAYLFRALPGRPTVEQAQDEIMRGFGRLDEWTEEGRDRVRGIVRQLLSGGRDACFDERPKKEETP